MLTPDGMNIIKYLKENLKLKAIKTDVYTGGDPMYESQITITLELGDEVISEVCI